MHLQVKFLKADIDNEALVKTVMDNAIASVVRRLVCLQAESHASPRCLR
jgi:hypothetical protein